jgi:rubredoxin
MANGLCDGECNGYREEPYAGSLWPGETEEDFGYPISADGTREEPDRKSCEQCEGEGTVQTKPAGHTHYDDLPEHVPCPFCGGKGYRESA